MAKSKTEKLTETNEVMEEASEIVQAEDAANENDGAEEMVRVYVPLDPKTKGYQQMFVGMNGRRFTVQRGKYVEVPKPVAEVLEGSIAQDMKTQEMIDELERQFMDAKI